MPIKWVRFRQNGQTMWGKINDGEDMIHVCSGSPLLEDHCTAERLPLDMTELMEPSTPTKIVCVGRNYREHARELGNEPPKEPLFFLKPPSSVLRPGAPILLPALSQQVEHEGELGVVIGRRCSRLRAGEDIRPYILGFTCVNDVTARDLQRRDVQWTRAKGFDTFCPFGPYVVEPGQGREFWRGLALETRVNGQIRQQGNTDDFLFPLDEILRAITAVMTLEAGDLIATGTPAGVGPLRAGDRVSVAIAGLGVLENPVAAGPAEA